MARDRRKALIEEIQRLRGSRVVVYVTSDRAPTPAQIGDDVVRPLYDHLRAIGRAPKLDFFIYSRGGAIDVPWRINTALRVASDEWCALIPFRANSAATLLALGADEIVLGKNGELGPIDPTMTVNRMVRGPGQPTMIQDSISVEDVMAYVRFVRERGGLSDQASLAAGIGKLVDRIDALTLGNLYRTHSHIRDVARRMLLSRKKNNTNEQTIGTIVETLAERVYAHGHAIGLITAREIGLPVTEAPKDVDEAMWNLLKEYEADLKLLDPIDPFVAIAGKTTHSEPGTIAVLESQDFAHEFRGEVHIEGRRQLPQQLNVALNLNLQLPPGIDTSQLPAEATQVLQQILQAAQQALNAQAQQVVMQALEKQAPVDNIDAGFRNGRWVRSDP